MAKVIKDQYPDIKIAFLGKAYTRAVIETCAYVDEFIDVIDFLEKKILIAGEKPQAIIHVFPAAAIAKRAKQLRIPIRIGTTNRLYHWLTCNKLVRLTRKNSDLHEAQLNLMLLAPLGIDVKFNDLVETGHALSLQCGVYIKSHSQPEIDTKFYSPVETGHALSLQHTSASETDAKFRFQKIADLYGFERIDILRGEFSQLIQPDKYNIILHPKSQGNGREWGLDNFIVLINLLDKQHYQVYISGTEKERLLLDTLLDTVGNTVTDITGRMDLKQFIAFINACDGLVASGTGPVHIAAALGKDAYGIYPPIRPIHPGRWAPLGKRAQVFVLDRTCNVCRNNSAACHCVKEITPYEIKAAIDKAASDKLRQLINI